MRKAHFLAIVFLLAIVPSAYPLHNGKDLLKVLVPHYEEDLSTVEVTFCRTQHVPHSDPSEEDDIWVHGIVIFSDGSQRDTLISLHRTNMAEVEDDCEVWRQKFSNELTQWYIAAEKRH